MPEIKYKRILLKVSGEALAGEAHRGLDFTIVNALCGSIKACVDMGVQIGLSSAPATSGGVSRTARTKCSAPTPTPWVCWAP